MHYGPSVMILISASFFITLAVVPLVIAFTARMRWLDQPAQRKEHRVPVPTMGGLAVYTGAAVSVLCLLPGSDARFMFMGAGSTVLLVTGLLDDRIGLPVSLRFIIQALLGVVLCCMDIRIAGLNGIFGIWQLPEVVQYGLTIVATIGIINAFNLIDGIDGLLSGLGLSSITLMAFYLIQMGEMPVAMAGLAWSSGLLAFYWFNAHPARIFIGDTGSLITGFIAAMMGILMIRGNTAMGTGDHLLLPNAPVLVFGILSIPVLDCLRVFATRIQRGKSPFSADKSHIHHLLTTAGMNHRLAVRILFVYQMLLLVGLFYFADAPYPLLLGGIFTGYVIAIRAMKIHKSAMHYEF